MLRDRARYCASAGSAHTVRRTLLPETCAHAVTYGTRRAQSASDVFYNILFFSMRRWAFAVGFCRMGFPYTLNVFYRFAEYSIGFLSFLWAVCMFLYCSFSVCYKLFIVYVFYRLHRRHRTRPCRDRVESVSKAYRKCIESMSKVYRKCIENVSNTYPRNVDTLSIRFQ